MKRTPFPPNRNSGGGDDEWLWLLTYADMITLLMAFFILLASISKVDQAKYEEVTASMAKEIGKRDQEAPMSALRADIDDLVVRLKMTETTGVGRDSTGVFLDLASSAFFTSGSAAVREDSRSVLFEVAKILNSPRYLPFQVEIQGHTDDAPISTPQFPSNWELSAARATGVVRILVEAGILPNRLRAVGMGEVSPKVPNRDPKGDPVPLNREINRRITVRIHAR
ncbi:MAG: flagellar motor protein MotB [Alphaproteobacteria bacterium]